MQNTKEIPQQNSFLVKRVSLVDSFKALPIGKPVTFDCREAGPMSSARSTVCRLNSAAGKEVFTIATEDNGATYQVTRKE